MARPRPTEPLTADEVGALLDACSTRSPSGLRLRALVAVMYGAGLRCAEALALEPRDLDLGHGLIRVRNGKGGRARVVGIDRTSGELIQAWLDRRPALGLGPGHPVFATYSAGNVGSPLKSRDVRAAFTRLGERAGVQKRVHPHALRHSLAYGAAMSGVPSLAVQQQLGHRRLATTEIYLRHLAPAQLVQAFRERDPYGVAAT